MKRSTAILAACGGLLIASPAAGAPSIVEFFAEVVEQDVTYKVRACDQDGHNTLYLYHDLTSAPEASTPADDSEFFGDRCQVEDTYSTFSWNGVAIGLYLSYVRLGTAIFTGVVAGPIEVCVGPDLVIEEFALQKDGATLTFQAKICNQGSMDAKKFRVGFWADHEGAPAPDDMGGIFKGIKLLGPGECYDLDDNGSWDYLQVSGGQRPNGDFVAWARIDSGDFVLECREGNNQPASIPYKMRNPDLYVESFTATVDGSTVTYTVKVCNKGAADVGKFFVDVYFDRPQQPPTYGEPGDVVQPVNSLGQDQCTDVVFTRENVSQQTYLSYCIVDTDDFISEPDEANNYGQPVPVVVGEGGTEPSTDCIDRDNDGHGVGPGCVGVPDCDDSDPEIHFGVTDVCGDGIDQDCDLTADDGCPGVDCIDNDGDGFGVGPDCVLEDYNDNDPEIYPWAPPETQGHGQGCFDLDADGWGVGPGCPGVPDCDDHDPLRHPGVGGEKCGDEVDNDCDFTVDDGCEGVDCTDADGDGWGVGPDCALQDPDDTNPQIYPYAQCVDADGDGFGVGSGCKGIPDCDDKNAAIKPGAEEICDDGVDNDCDLTVDDGCPGVDCTDGDGDSFGVGDDCVLPDCDDDNPAVFPWADETCGDNKDDNCNGIADEGCIGRQCVDRDADGFGVGQGCPGPQDCDDGDFMVKPGGVEVCGDGVDQDCDNVPDDGCSTSVDNDGDGFGVGGGTDGQPDCDDSDPTVNPGAQETCDGVDNDCDGTVDDGCPGVDCIDGDGDGWGVGEDCAIVDCDDNAAEIYPWAAEICDDGKDNDCDGTVDDGCPGVDCVDNDHDSWGVGADCAAGKADCDDEDGGTNPWVREICADGKDNNCNGSVDESCLVCEDRDGDGHGIGPKCSSWDCNDGDDRVFPGAEEICDLKDNDCDEIVPPEELDCALDDGGCGCSTVEPTPSALTLLLLAAFSLARRARRRR